MENNQKKSLIKEYFEKEIEVIKRLNIEEILEAINVIIDTNERGGNIYIFGNGGSAATASHFVCDFNKGVSEKLDKKFKFVCLNDNIPTMLAIANDFSYDEIFRMQLKGRLKQNDLVIAISGSGNSRNVIKAVEYAKEMHTPVIGITGYDGGHLRKLSDYHMDAMVDDMQITEDIHMIFDHMMFYVLKS